MIARDDARKYGELMNLMRSAQHADKNGYKEFSQKLAEIGS